MPGQTFTNLKQLSVDGRGSNEAWVVELLQSNPSIAELGLVRWDPPRLTPEVNRVVGALGHLRTIRIDLFPRKAAVAGGGAVSEPVPHPHFHYRQWPAALPKPGRSADLYSPVLSPGGGRPWHFRTLAVADTPLRTLSVGNCEWTATSQETVHRCGAVLSRLEVLRMMWSSYSDSQYCTRGSELGAGQAAALVVAMGT